MRPKDRPNIQGIDANDSYQEYLVYLDKIHQSISGNVYNGENNNPVPELNKLLGTNPNAAGKKGKIRNGLANVGADKKYIKIIRDTPAFTNQSIPDYRTGSAGSWSQVTVSVPSTGTFKKNTIRKTLFPYYRGIYDKCDYAYTNYNCLNFFTASQVLNNSAIIYPDPSADTLDHSPLTGAYRPDSEFSFEFWINPRYTTDKEGDEFKAGTILHYSSTYAISLVSGSSLNKSGTPNGFRLLLQLSSSADIKPSDIAIDTPQSDVDGLPALIFTSSDNSILKNNWHHVAIRWGGSDINNGTGSFFIDGKLDSEFLLSRQSISIPAGSSVYAGFGSGRNDPDCLVVGNYFEGINAGATQTSRFFNRKTATNEGLLKLSSFGGDPTGANSAFNHRLNAEMHEIKIFKQFRDLKQIVSESIKGYGSSSMDSAKSNGLCFYLPCLFEATSPVQRIYKNTKILAGGKHIMKAPFNVTMSFCNGGLDICLPTFLKEHVQSRYPRLFNLTGSEGASGTEGQTATERLFQKKSFVTKDLTILPCDNGKFRPDFTLLLSGPFEASPTTGSLLSRYVDDTGSTNLTLISLNSMLDDRMGLKETAKNRIKTDLFEPQRFNYNEDDWDFYGGPSENDSWATYLTQLVYFNNGVSFRNSPLKTQHAFSSSGGGDTSDGGGGQLYVFQASGDESSNHVCFFDIPSIFYGNAIHPNTFEITDTSYYGSGGKVKIILRDNGFGTLYRDNCVTPSAKWNSVGNLFYNEGIAFVKSPHISLFGSASFETSFKGSSDVNSAEYLAAAPKNFLNSSSNLTYKELAPTDNVNENATSFVYITDVLLHDDDLNVVGRAKLSQPIVKRPGDELLFKLKKDF